MIVALAGSGSLAAGTLLLVNLAVLRARSGRKICLIDTAPRAHPHMSAFAWSCEWRSARQWPSIAGRAASSHMLAHDIDELVPEYGDLFIDTDGHDSQGTLSALIAARIVVVPVTVDHVDVDRHYPLIARLNAARMFNPALQVLFVLVTDGATPPAGQLAAVRRYVAQVMSATLAETVLHLHGDRDVGRGRCVCDAETCDPEAAAELHALYREIYVH